MTWSKLLLCGLVGALPTSAEVWPAQVCQSVYTLRMDTESALAGPLLGVTPPHYRNSFELGEGMRIEGKPPWSILLCDGHVRIIRL